MKIDARITESDKFLEMPFSAQCLYFHYAILADNNGVVTNPKATRRAVGVNYSDFQLLEQNDYLILYDDKVFLNTGKKETNKKGK